MVLWADKKTKRVWTVHRAQILLLLLESWFFYMTWSLNKYLIVFFFLRKFSIKWEQTSHKKKTSCIPKCKIQTSRISLVLNDVFQKCHVSSRFPKLKGIKLAFSDWQPCFTRLKTITKFRRNYICSFIFCIWLDCHGLLTLGHTGGKADATPPPPSRSSCNFEKGIFSIMLELSVAVYPSPAEILIPQLCAQDIWCCHANVIITSTFGQKSSFLTQFVYFLHFFKQNCSSFWRNI